MKCPFPLFIALKYLRPQRSMVSIITVLTTMGIVLGVAVLIVVLAVMTGFDDMHQEHMIRLDSHIQISSDYNHSFPSDPVLDVLKQIPEIKAAAPTVEGFVMMIRHGQTITAILRGIHPARERDISDIKQSLLEGTLPPDDESVVVGNRLASMLGIWTGDRLIVYSPQCFVGADELRLPAELRVCGIFSVGMYDVDSKFMICSLPAARDVFAMENGVQKLRIITTDPYKTEKTGRAIQKKLDEAAQNDENLHWLRSLNIRSWMNIHQHLLSTLKVEKDMMFILLCGISLVAAMSVTNTLITLCVQKTHEIGLLKALGFSNGRIVGVFFILGSIQGGFGCLFGVFLGLLMSANLDAILNFLRQFNPGLMSAQFYQFIEMPSHATVEDVTAVCLIVMIFSTLAGVLPALRATRMEPVDALRYE